jgi:hypothetical protein
MNVLFGTGGDPDAVGIDESVEAAEASDGIEVDLTQESVVDIAAVADDDGTAVVDDSGEDAEEAEEVADDDGAEAGEDDDSDGEDDPGETPAPAVSFRYANQEEAERAHAELRAEFNRVLNERNNPPQNQTPVQEYEPAPDASRIAQVAQSNPYEAFNMALEAGDPSVVNQIIGMVDTDKSGFAARAAIAAEEGDMEAAQQWNSRAVNAAGLAEQMRSERYQAEYEAAIEQQTAPLVEDRFNQAASSAANQAMARLPEIEGVDYAAYDAAIGQYVQANQHVMGDWSPESMQRGFYEAAAAVVFGGMDKLNEYVVQQRVAAEVAKQLGAQTPKPRAGRGTAGGAGRRAPAAPRSVESSDVEDTQQSVVAAQPAGMNVLFNRG